jgi:hypothetical protein
MFKGNRVTIDPSLLARARDCASRQGYSSVDEFVAHAVEQAIERLEQAASEQDVRKRLKGLGYLS